MKKDCRLTVEKMNLETKYFGDKSQLGPNLALTVRYHDCLLQYVKSEKFDGSLFSTEKLRTDGRTDGRL